MPYLATSLNNLSNRQGETGDRAGALATITEARQFFTEHHDQLNAENLRSLLEGVFHDTARQHLAILDLADHRGIADAYRIITDPSHARNVLLDTIESGQLNLLEAVLGVAPALRDTGAGVLAIAVLIAQPDPDRAGDFTKLVKDNSTDLERRAHITRLRELRPHHPAPSSIDRLVAILADDS